MPKTLIYICGRDQDLNSTMCVSKGKILFQLANYTQVYTEVPKPKHSDECVYALLIDEDKIVPCVEVRGEVVQRVWEGPKGGMLYRQYKVQCEIYPLISPLTPEVTDVPAPTLGNLKSILASANDMVLEEMPYIGAKNRDNLRKWAAGGSDDEHVNA